MHHALLLTQCFVTTGYLFLHSGYPHLMSITETNQIPDNESKVKEICFRFQFFHEDVHDCQECGKFMHIKGLLCVYLH